MKKILLYEPWAKKTLHFEFNKCILKILATIYSNHEIIYCGDKDQIELLKKNLAYLKDIKYIELEVLDYTNQNKTKLLIQEFKNIKFIKSLNADRYFITNTLPHTLLYLKLLFSKNNSITSYLHGLDVLYSGKKGVYKFLPLIFKFKSKMNIRYIVLGESIKSNLLKMFPKLSEKIFSIDHPYTFLNEEELKININQNKDILKIGTIGQATKAKGFLEYLYTIKKNQNKKIKFYHIGKIEDCDISNLNINVPSNKKALSNEEYQKNILELDCILYFYPRDSYKLTASGAIFDSLKYNKPIIAIRNDYFEYIFNKVGKIGYLFNTKDEILEFLNSKNFNTNLFDEKIYDNIKNAKLYFSEEAIEVQMKSILEIERSE